MNDDEATHKLIVLAEDLAKNIGIWTGTQFVDPIYLLEMGLSEVIQFGYSLGREDEKTRSKISNRGRSRHRSSFARIK